MDTDNSAILAILVWQMIRAALLEPVGDDVVDILVTRMLDAIATTIGDVGLARLLNWIRDVVKDPQSVCHPDVYFHGRVAGIRVFLNSFLFNRVLGVQVSQVVINQQALGKIRLGHPRSLVLVTYAGNPTETLIATAADLVVVGIGDASAVRVGPGVHVFECVNNSVLLTCKQAFNSDRTAAAFYQYLTRY